MKRFTSVQFGLLVLFSSAGVVAQSQFGAQKLLGFQANITDRCQVACASLTSVLEGKVYSDQIPSELFADYFSQQQQQVIPACVVLPTSPEDVSAAVKIIGQKECIFAVKSGGHATFPGASNCPGCINLDLRYLNSLDVSEDLSTAFVGTSNRWGDVYNYLEHMNITVIGGRGTQVGVGGFLLGGGISFISRRYGWGLDNVRNYEIVLANGSISNISQSTHPDLYWALRGGGKNFGIVTRFDLETVPQKQMYGGLNIFLLSDARNRFSRLKIIRNFSWTRSWFLEKAADWANQMACLVGYCITFDNFTKLVAWNSIEVLSDLDAQLYGWMVLLPYTHTYIVGTQVNHGVAASNASAYEPLRKLKHVFTTNRVSKYTDFIQEITENNDRGNRQTYVTTSFKVDMLMLTKTMEIFMSEIDHVRNFKGILPALVLQVLSKEEISHFSKNGGNSLGITEDDGPLSLIQIAISWHYEADDEAIMRAANKIIDRCVAVAKEMEIHHPYIYQNYAAKHQDVFAGYGAKNRRRLQEIQKKYDHNGVLSRLQPGYFQV